MDELLRLADQRRPVVWRTRSCLGADLAPTWLAPSKSQPQSALRLRGRRHVDPWPRQHSQA